MNPGNTEVIGDTPLSTPGDSVSQRTDMSGLRALHSGQGRAGWVVQCKQSKLLLEVRGWKAENDSGVCEAPHEEPKASHEKLGWLVLSHMVR